MNARQKAKRYKRMYKELLNRPVVPKIIMEQHKVDTLRFKRYYPEALLKLEDKNYVRGVITTELAHDIAKNLDKYIDYETGFEPHLNKYYFSGEIKIVNRDYKEKICK